MKPWKGRLFALGLGLGLVFSFEALLRLVPSLAPPPFVLEVSEVGEQALYTLNPDYPRRFFAGTIGGRSLVGMRMAPHPYLEPPRENTFRVVVVGGSTVQGFPHPRRLTAASYLQVMLQDVWPHRQVQVFNAGITAVASFAVARAVEDAMVMQPDLVVVYTGHNEFYGVYGAASLRKGGEGVWKKLHYALMQWRMVGLLRQVIDLFREPPPPSTSLMDVFSRAGYIQPDHPCRQTVSRTLEANLRQIAETCRSHNVPVVLATLVSNDTGYAPANSGTPASLSESQKELWEYHLNQALARLEQEGNKDEERVLGALQHLDEAAELWSRNAFLQFLRGRTLILLGKSAEARDAFVLARNLDPQPWRAPEAFNLIVRKVARAERVMLGDVEAAFRRAAPSSGVGWNLMSDHLHPSASGQILLARAIVSALCKAPSPLGITREEEERLRSEEEYRRRLGDLPIERWMVVQSMSQFFNEPPLDVSNRRRASQLQMETAATWNRLSEPEQRGYVKWVEQEQKTGPLVLSVADHLFAAQDFEHALQHYRAARLEEPYTVWGDLWSTLRWGRCLELLYGHLEPMQRREIERAIERSRFLAQAPDLDPAFLDFFMGYAHHLLEEGDQALHYLEIAVADAGIQRHFLPDLLSILCEELLDARRYDDAERYVKDVMERHGQEEFGRYLLQHIRARYLADQAASAE